MANDATFTVRRGVLALAKGIDAITALVPEDAIDPLDTEAWPFITYGSPIVTPIVAGCVDGCEIRFALHGFSKGRWSGDTLLEDARDHSARIGAALAAGLGGRAVPLDGGKRGKIRWLGSQHMMDGAERGAWHTIQEFRVRVLA